MSKPQTTTDSPELIKLRLQAQQAEIKERQALLTNFLGTVKKMVKDQAALHLPKTLDDTQRSAITKPQVFLSYAWEETGTTRLAYLQTFLEQFRADMEAAGLTPWLDLPGMTGHMGEKMRVEIHNSQYALLIGTDRYAQRTLPESKTNVRRELLFALEKIQDSSDFLLPLLFEGEFGATFPEVSKDYLTRDCRSWFSLRQGQWHSIENYIRGFTQLSPLGILPCLLGLNRTRDYPKYRRACRKAYEQHQRALENALQLLQARRESKTDENKPEKVHREIHLTPILQIPSSLLEYDPKEDFIGHGSYGDVYRSHWQQHDEAVAVKVLTGELTAQAEKDLHREASIMAHLHDSRVAGSMHTVRLLGLVVEKPRFALVMEYLPMGTLFRLLHKEDVDLLPWDLCYQLALDIARGLQILHGQNILHRDLRSQNILLFIQDQRLRAKLSDFGLSTVKNSIRRTTTDAKSLRGAGTLGWKAPELLKPDGHSSYSSDVYSYGMLLWELAAREVPFANMEDEFAIRQSVLEGKMETIPGDCPPKLAGLIKQCWSLEPENRPTVTKIIEEISALAQAEPKWPETAALVEEMKKEQTEKESQWRVKRQAKQVLTAQKKAEEDQRQLEVKKLQDKIARLEQAEEKRQSISASLPAESPPVRKNLASPPKTEPVTSTSQNQYVLTTPKPAASPEQLQLQDQLITACKQGDEKAVKALLQQGAKPDMTNAKGEQPLGAAVWGMCPDVVNTLLKQTGGVASMTWEECEEHNLKYYQEIFILPKFDPKTYDEWHQLLLKIDRNPFLRTYHLKKADEQWHDKDTSSWKDLIRYVSCGWQSPRQQIARSPKYPGVSSPLAAITVTERGYADFRSQIKQEIETASSPIAEKILPKLLPESKKPWNPREAESATPVLQNRWLIAPKPESKSIDKGTLEQLLRLVAEGEQDKAEELIKKDNNLLLHAGNVTDLSGREFKGITAFQYALWAMDWHMWTMIQKYLPREAQSQQFAALESKGTAYGKHFSLQPLIGALQTYVDNAEKVWKFDQRATDHWCKVVGEAQKALPAHVVNEYCRSDRSFHPCPQEWESKLSRTREMDVWDSTQSNYVKGSWFVAPSSKDGLGLNFAFYRGGVCRAGGTGLLHGGACGLAHADLKALQSLWKTRTQQLELLKSDLLPWTGYSAPLSMAQDDFSPDEDNESKDKINYRKEWKQSHSHSPLPPRKNSESLRKVEQATPVSQNRYGLTTPKRAPILPVSAEQLQLQDQLITACKQGDEKAVTTLLQRGAKADIPNTKGEQPLGAAVWGMCPDVVNTLFKQAGDVALMTWRECEKHNLKHYKEVFIVPEFDPQTFEEWNTLLQKMDPNPFICAFHLKKVDERWHDSDSSSWVNLKRYVDTGVGARRYSLPSNVAVGAVSATEQGYVGFRTQIKQGIEAASSTIAEKILPKLLPESKKPWNLREEESVTPVLQNRWLTAPKPESKSIDKGALKQLLRLVAEGEQDKAEELIKEDNSLLLHTGNMTDLSGREFESITAFQYALWAMDWHMWKMIQKYLPEEEQWKQFELLETKGTLHGKHFSLQPLIGALQVYADNADKVWHYDHRATNHWCKVVGGEQKLLPVHVVNEYCRGDRPFEPCPPEWESKLPRTREVPKIFDSTQSKNVKGSWFTPISSKDRLGLTYAFLRFKWEPCWSARLAGPDPRALPADIKALQSLWKTRMQQLELLRSDLLPRTGYSASLSMVQDDFSPDEDNESKDKIHYRNEQKQSHSYSPLPPRKNSESPRKVELATPVSKNRYGLTAVSAMQLQLQDQLIAACKQGDEKAVKALLQQGATPDMANAKGEQPLGAAVWGMCPDVVNALLKQTGGVAPITWDECEKHNLKHYKEVFIVPKFDPQTFCAWSYLLRKMEPNPFIREFHLKKVDEQWQDNDTASWDNLKRWIDRVSDVDSRGVEWRVTRRDWARLLERGLTEAGYVGFRSQIKQGVETAKQPTVDSHVYR